MGRKAKPLKIKILEGCASHRPLPTKEPVPPADRPTPPGHLDNYGLEEWERIVEVLDIMGILSSSDQSVLAAYCSAYSRWRSAEEELKRLSEVNRLSALVIQTTNGNDIQHPLIGIANKAAKEMVCYAAEFGLTPSARAKLGLEYAKKNKSKFEGLLYQGGRKK